MSRRGRVLQAVRQANRPGPPEHSLALRIGACGSVVAGIVACRAQGELSSSFTAAAIALVVVGNAISYRRRTRPLPYLKLLLAGAMVGAFVWFFHTVSSAASAGDLTSVEGPLAALFTAMQAAHSFDVPSRRDLGFSLVGSASLMAVAAAQAIGPLFGLLVLAWAAFLLVGLVALWGSMAGGARPRARTVVPSILAVLLVAAVLIALLPAPHPATGLVVPSAFGAGVPANQPSLLVHGHGAKHSGRSASPSGPTRVGGFLGFAGPLDTAVRASLGNEVVLRVRADRPTFWIAETFDTWNGQSWSETVQRGAPAWRQVDAGPPFSVPRAAGEPSDALSRGSADYQTFYLATGGTDLVLHASAAADVWFPASRIYVGRDGTIKAGTSLGAGSIYTVLSSVQTPSASQLAATGESWTGPGATSSEPSAARGAPSIASRPPTSADAAPVPRTLTSQYLQLPHPYPRAAALAARVTAGHHTVFGKIVALENWIGAHTRYTTDIPPLRPGQDTVDQFLFGNRRGYCEQISTSLAVMLRTLGIPAREATGYVPGPYDPITDLYDVEAKDAHAWVQVWFPGYGWQSFDPTAFVPLANPTPAAALGHDLGIALHHVPLVPIGAVLVAAIVLAVFVRRRRRRPRTWGAAVTRELERAARKLGIAVVPSESLGSLARRLDAALGPPGRVPAAPGPPGRVPAAPGPPGRVPAAPGPPGPSGDRTAPRPSPPPASPPPSGDHTGAEIPAPPAASHVAAAAERAAWRGTDPDPATARSYVHAARQLRRTARRAALRHRRGRPRTTVPG